MTFVVYYVPLCLWGQPDSGHGHSLNRFKVTWRHFLLFFLEVYCGKMGVGVTTSFTRFIEESHSKRVYVASQEARGWHGNHFSILPNFFLFIPSNCGRTFRARMYSALIGPFYDPSRSETCMGWKVHGQTKSFILKLYISIYKSLWTDI